MRALSTRGLRRWATLAIVLALSLVTLPAVTSSASATSSWTLEQSTTPPIAWSTVAYLDGQWIALSHSGNVATSSDGASWTDQSAPIGSWNSVAYGAGRYVALSSANVTPNEMTSTDGQQWSTLPGPPGTPEGAGRPTGNGQWTGITYGHGLFVAVSAAGTVDTSPNGLTWTQRFWRPKNNFTSITYGDGRFVAVDAAQGDILLSLNGVNWSLIFRPLTGAVPAPAGDLHFGAVSYGSGNFVAFGNSASGAGYVATSVFGYIWTLHQYSPAQEVDAATYGCGTFVAGGTSTGPSDPLISSPTGTEWTSATIPTPTPSSWTSISYGAGQYVAVDAAGDIATSRGQDCAATVPTAPLQVSGNVHNGEVWTYMHPSSHAGGAPVEGYRVTITDGVTTTTCHAAVYYQPNCIIKGLHNHTIYWVTAQAYNRFGYSAPTDPEFVIPVASRSLQVAASISSSSQAVPSYSPSSSSVDLQLTGVLANAEGFYPVTTVVIHLGATVESCRPNPFGECLITVSNPPAGAVPTYATYSGYGHSYRSATMDLTIP